VVYQQVEKPESGIVPGIDVIGPGISEADYQTNVRGKRSH
jgi:hypothetical protein